MVALGPCLGPDRRHFLSVSIKLLGCLRLLSWGPPGREDNAR